MLPESNKCIATTIASSSDAVGENDRLFKSLPSLPGKGPEPSETVSEPTHALSERFPALPSFTDIIKCTCSKERSAMLEVVGCALEIIGAERSSSSGAARSHDEEYLNGLYQTLNLIHSHGGEVSSELKYPSAQQERELFQSISQMCDRFEVLARMLAVEDLRCHAKTHDKCEPASDRGVLSSDTRRRPALNVKYLESICAQLREHRERDLVTADAHPNISEERAALEGSLAKLKAEILRVREYLITSNRGLVFSNVTSMCRADSAKRIKEDLQSAGMVGLMNAVDGFDLGYEVRLSTFATLLIRQNILKELRIHDVLRKKGHESTFLLSLNGDIGSGGEDYSLLSLICNKRVPAPELSVEIRDEFESLLGKIKDGIHRINLSTERQTERATVLIARVFGLDGQKVSPLADVADSLGISRGKALDLLCMGLHQVGIESPSLLRSRLSKHL